MITRITKANADKYRALFADAVLALQTHDSEGELVSVSGKEPIIPIVPVTYEPVQITAEEYEPGFHYVKKGEEWVLTSMIEGFSPDAEYAIAIESGEEITTLEEYFCYIADLHKIDKKFTILPLEDEENFFHINANTRTIEIPKSFVDNGISVQGDEIAEMLYFKIDRYFDMDDLGEKDVFIEWCLPADPETGERKTGVSIPHVINTEIDPGFVIVGWPIRAELTQIPGKLDFAVRFYTIDDEGTYANRIVYSFSTMMATVDIKPSLNLDIEKIALDGSALNSEDLIGSRLENSTSKDDVTPDPVTPAWVDFYFENLPQEEELLEDDGNALYETYKVYLTNKETGEEVDGIFVVQANITDSGRLSYNWIKRDQDGEVILDYDGGDSSTFVEVRSYDETPADVKFYGEADELGNHPEFVFTEEIPDLAAAQAAGIKVYVRVAKIVMNHSDEKFPVLGSYQARAINRLGRKTARAFSPIALIEGPSVPEITTDLGERVTFAGEALDAELTVVADVDPHAYVTYQLYRSAEKEGDYAAYGNVATSNKFVIDGKAYAEDEPDADLGDGYYYVNIKTKLNSVTTSVNGEPIRVTHVASPVSIENSEPTYNVGSVTGHDINKPLEVAVELHPSEVGKRAEEDKIEYQWFKYVGPTEEQIKIDIDKAEKGEYLPTQLDELIDGANKNNVQIINTVGNEQGFYYCRVTNTYNGTTNIKCSNFFNVIDTKINA